MENNEFSYRLRERLESLGKTQRVLAEEAQTTEATISRYVAGLTQPEISIVARIAKAIGTSVDYLCGLTDMSTPKESLGLELHLLMKCYDRADQHDKKTLWTILERYMTSEEKESPINISTTGTWKARIG